MRKNLIIAVLFLYCLLWGDFPGKVTPAQDVSTVVNPKDPVPPEGSRKRLIFTPELTIGAQEGDENYMFGNSVQVIADDRGNFYVLDWDRKRIQKYDPQGKHLLTVGRQGQGPGEFGNIWEMRFDREGHIYATDIVNKRVSYFSTADGQFKKQFRIEQNIGGAIFLSSGKFFSTKSIQKEESGVMTVDFQYGLFDEKCQLVTELYMHKGGFQSPRRQGSRAEFMAAIMSNSAYKPYAISRVTDEERILIGYSEIYEIKVFDQDGKLLQVIQKKSDPRKVSRQHEDYNFRHQVADFLRSFPQDASLKEEIRKHMKYPKYLPAYLGFIPMDNGWLFVVVDSLENKSEIDLFDEKGVYIGRFETDIPALTLFFKNEKAYAVTSVNDFNFVQRYGYKIVDY
jgi:hypothetical protein